MNAVQNLTVCCNVTVPLMKAWNRRDKQYRLNLTLHGLRTKPIRGCDVFFFFSTSLNSRVADVGVCDLLIVCCLLRRMWHASVAGLCTCSFRFTLSACGGDYAPSTAACILSRQLSCHSVFCGDNCVLSHECSCYAHQHV